MNNDRELLELAAKAAGVTHPVVLKKHLASGWNPLTDDGDALRLAVKLYFTVQVDEEDAKTYVVSDGGLWVEIESHTADPLAATRLAIVRAAAEIGRDME